MSNAPDRVVTLALPLSFINYALSVAAERPFKESSGFIQALQSKTQAWLDAHPDEPTADSFTATEAS